MLQILIMHGVEWPTKSGLIIKVTDLGMLSQLMVQGATMTSEMVNKMTKDVDIISLSMQELKMHLLT
jgi:hypothetical protein